MPADAPGFRHSIDAILEAMDRYGGSFVQHLAELYRYADPMNRAILETCFAKFFTEYDEMAGFDEKPPAK